MVVYIHLLLIWRIIEIDNSITHIHITSRQIFVKMITIQFRYNDFMHNFGSIIIRLLTYLQIFSFNLNKDKIFIAQ